MICYGRGSVWEGRTHRESMTLDWKIVCAILKSLNITVEEFVDTTNKRLDPMIIALKSGVTEYGQPGSCPPFFAYAACTTASILLLVGSKT